MARVDREGPVQRSIVNHIRTAHPSWIVHHCKNEIKKRGANIAREIHQAKVNGMVVGFPDLIVIPFSQPAVFFEVKAEGNYASEAQKLVHADLVALGHKVAVVRSIEDVTERLREWGLA